MKLADIRIDGSTQSRAEVNQATVAEYAEAIGAGAKLPAVVVFFDGVSNWLADGFHRYHAARHAKREEIDADCRNGTQRDAVLYSLGANAEHGLRRTNADKRKAVETLIRDVEWSKWSDREISRICGVGAPLVGDIRKSICNPITDRAEKRTVKRGGKVFQQSVPAKITPIAAVPAVIVGDEEGDDGPDTSELMQTMASDNFALIAENKEMAKVIEASEPLAEAMKTIKQLREQVRINEERIRGLMNEKNQALAQAKMWMNKFQKLEKSMKAEAF